MSDTPDQSQTFATAAEATRKAKADFLDVLRSAQQLNLGVDAPTLERAEPGALVRRLDLDFAKLLTADSTTTFDSLVAAERNIVVPFLTGDAVVSIVEIAQGADGWRVVGLGGRDMAAALDTVRRALADTPQPQVTLYEVPNLQARVYGARRGDVEMFFTDYRGRYSLQQGVPAVALVPVLQRDAVEFERLYGDSARRGRLLR